MKRTVLGLLAAAVIAGCGGKVVVDVGGATTGSGSGGSGSGGSGGAPAKVCGGKQGLQCGPDEWCQWDPSGSCGNADGTGVCQPRPTSCDDGCGIVPVCGCDGTPYCNPCDAHVAGFDVHDSIGSCLKEPTATFAAYVLPTSAPRYAIAKADFAANRCVVIYMVGFGSGGFPNVQTTMDWSVERIGITPQADDCLLAEALWPPPPGMVQAADAKGSIKQDSTGFPCVVNVDVSVAFPPGSPSWVPPVEPVTTSNDITVQNGGCAP